VSDLVPAAVNNIIAIVNSDPSAINALAEQWQEFGNTTATVKQAIIDPALVRASASWATGREALNGYGLLVGDGLTVLSEATHEVAAGLRNFATQLAALRSDIINALETIAVAIGSSLLVAALPAAWTIVTTLVRPAALTASLLALWRAVDTYNSHIGMLSSTLDSATQQFATLASMNATNGIVPDPPRLPATPN
jgi:hypothetical protein